jgi:hypothetical protein
MRTKYVAGLVVAMLTGLTPAHGAAQSSGSVVRAIQIVEEGGLTRVTIDADGPLPVPLSESLNNPPRIFFDLAGVTHKIKGPTVTNGGGVVRRVRIALHEASPPVTRVVIDLTRPENHRVYVEPQAGQIRVFVGSESAITSGPIARAPVPPPVPPPAAPVSTNPRSNPVARAPIVGPPPPPLQVGSTTPPIPGTAAPAPIPVFRPSPFPTRSPV